MNRRQDRSERLQDYLDGLLGPDDEAEVRERLRESPEWRREHRRLAAVHSLLDTSLDVDPPADLLPAVLAALGAEMARPRRLFGLPARVENGLVLAGTAALAALVFQAGRALPTDPAGWAGRLTVGVASAFEALKNAVVGLANSATQLDWIGRLAGTLVEATRTAVTSSAQPLLALTVGAVALTTLVAWALLRTERGRREGGVHVGLLA